MNWKSAVLAGVVVVPLLIVLALGFGQDPHAVPFVLDHKPAPAFHLQTLDGKVADLVALRGKPVVLNFWATWCYPCKAEHELLQEAAVYYGDRVQFYGVIYQDGADEVRRYLASRSNHYPQVIDPESRTAIDFGVAGVPESFFIDAAGQIVHKEAGVLTSAVLRGVLDQLLTKKGS